MDGRMDRRTNKSGLGWVTYRFLQVTDSLSFVSLPFVRLVYQGENKGLE
jgi:hypothetical protein